MEVWGTVHGAEGGDHDNLPEGGTVYDANNLYRESLELRRKAGEPLLKDPEGAGGKLCL